MTSANLGPLPIRFKPGTRVRAVINGKAHFGVVRGKNRQVKVSPKGLACGVYPIVINDVPNTRAIRAVMRIWVITGPKHILRIGFPLPEPPLGLS